MKYISLDIETTGLNPLTTNVLEIGAIVEDTKNPQRRELCSSFHAYIWRDIYQGEPFALAMNAHIFKKILVLKKNNDPLLMREEEVVPKFIQFMQNNGQDKWVIGGKNVMGFDIPFLKQLPMWEKVRIHRRHIDPTIHFVNWDEDVVPPDMTTCKKRAGLPELVTHEALDDAWDIITLVRAANGIK